MSLPTSEFTHHRALADAQPDVVSSRGFSGAYADLTGAPTIPINTYSYFPIWAEENASLSNNAFEWSFGNGNETPNGMGIILPFACQFFALCLTLEGNATCTVEAWKNTASSGKSVSTSNSKKGWIEFSDSAVNYVAGDVVNFRTVTGHPSSKAGIVVAWFRKEELLR